MRRYKTQTATCTFVDKEPQSCIFARHNNGHWFPVEKFNIMNEATSVVLEDGTVLKQQTPSGAPSEEEPS